MRFREEIRTERGSRGRGGNGKKDRYPCKPQGQRLRFLVTPVIAARLEHPRPPSRYLMISVEWVQVFQGPCYQLTGNVAIEFGQLPGDLEVKLRPRQGFCWCLVFALLLLLLGGDPLLDRSQGVRSEGSEIPLIWKDHRVASVIHFHPRTGMRGGSSESSGRQKPHSLPWSSALRGAVGRLQGESEVRGLGGPWLWGRPLR